MITSEDARSLTAPTLHYEVWSKYPGGWFVENEYIEDTFNNKPIEFSTPEDASRYILPRRQLSRLVTEICIIQVTVSRAIYPGEKKGEAAK